MTVGILEKLPILHTKSAIFGLCGHGLTLSDVTHMRKGNFFRKRVGQAASMENFQIIKYFDPNISVLLSDKKEIEVASCRY